MKKYAPGTIVEGPVSNLTNFGCFVSWATVLKA